MVKKKYKYIVIGAGLVGCGAVEERIRTQDATGSVLLADTFLDRKTP
jgi:succinate dehydrogenase/fumarate reductase flavoprotein subunit